MSESEAVWEVGEKMQQENWKAMMEDAEYEKTTIRNVTVHEDSVDLTFETGWSFGYDRKLAADFVPEVGMKVTQWGKGVGYPVRGLMIADRVIYYRTAAEEEERHRQWCQEKDRKEREEYAAKRQSNDERIQRLPVEFQRRIYSFQLTSPEWGPKFEGYELFVCEQAIAIAKRINTPEAIKSFHSLPWAEQKQQVPELTDDHSGNTFGSTCSLASLFLTNPELVEKQHGALCPLVGCEEYGCYAARNAA